MENSNSNTYTSNLNNFNITHVAFNDTLDKECVRNSTFGESINIDDNAATPPRILARQMSNATEDSATTFLASTKVPESLLASI